MHISTPGTVQCLRTLARLIKTYLICKSRLAQSRRGDPTWQALRRTPSLNMLTIIFVIVETRELLSLDEQDHDR